MKIVEIELSKLVSDKDNPRKNLEDIEELAQSITINGQQEPLIVEELGDGTFLIDNGHRRQKAFEIIKKRTKKEPKVKCIVGSNLSQHERLFKQCVIENQNKKWRVPERDKAWKKLWEGMPKNMRDKKSFAKKLGTNVTAIEDFFDRIKLPEEIQEMELGMNILAETKHIKEEDRIKLLKRAKKEDIGRQEIRKIKKVINNTESQILKDAVIEGKMKPEHADKVKELSEERQKSAIFVSEVAQKHVERSLDILKKRSMTETTKEKKQEIMRAREFVEKLEDSILSTANEIIAIKGVLEQINEENLDENFTDDMKSLLIEDLNELTENSKELNVIIDKQKKRWGANG